MYYILVYQQYGNLQVLSNNDTDVKCTGEISFEVDLKQGGKGRIQVHFRELYIYLFERLMNVAKLFKLLDCRERL